MACKALSYLALAASLTSSPTSLCKYIALSSLLHLSHDKLTDPSGILHLLFPLPEIFFPEMTSHVELKAQSGARLRKFEFSSCLTLDKLFNLFVPQFLRL